MLGAKDVPKLMNQSDHINGRFRGGAGVAKRCRNVEHNVVSQPLAAIADAIHSPPPAVINVNSLPGKGDKQVVSLSFSVEGKFLFQSNHQTGCGGDLLLRWPRGGALNDEADAKFVVKVVRRRFDQPTHFFIPARVSLAQGWIPQRLNPNGSQRQIFAHNAAGGQSKYTKDATGYPSGRSHQ